MKKITWKLIEVKASELKPNPKNPKKRDQKGFARLQKSLSKFGKVFDGIANKDLSLIDGHSRLELSKPNQILKVFVPSRQLSEAEYSEMNAIFDLAKAGDTDHGILQENFGEDFFTEWDLNPEKKETKPPEITTLWLLNIELENEAQTKSLYEELVERGMKVKIIN